MIRRTPLLLLAIVLALVKSFQYAIDSTALFYYDSGAFIRNALHIGFLPARSYVYGYMIRIFAVPSQSLPAIVAMQMVMGGVTGWLLGYMLMRLLHVRAAVVLPVALLFAFDPVQIVHEHLILTEAAALVVMAAFLVTASQYLQTPDWWRLVPISVLGILLVSLRIVYLPLVFLSAVLLPLAGVRSPARWRAVGLALAISCGSTFLLHRGYMELTGSLAKREPAYHYVTGFFLLAAAAPLIEPQDAGDPRVMQAVIEQNQSNFPLSSPNRSQQMWSENGLVARLKGAFHGDEIVADRAAQHLAYRAISRNPLGFLKLGLEAYLDYWRRLPSLSAILHSENGSGAGPVVLPYDAVIIRHAFGEDVSAQNLLDTPSRRYHIWGRGWNTFLLVSPLLAAIALSLSWRRPTFLIQAFLLAWSCLLLAATCLGSDDSYRYLHPFSFTGLIAVGLLIEIILTSRPVSRPVDFGHSQS